MKDFTNNSIKELALEIETVLGLNISRFFEDLKVQESNKELTEQEKRYICLSFLGYEPWDIANMERKDYLAARYPGQDDEIKKGIDNRARDVRSFIAKQIAPKIKLFVAENGYDMETIRQGVNWGMLLCELKKIGYSQLTLSKDFICGTIESDTPANLQKIYELLKQLRDLGLAIDIKSIE